LRAACSVTHRAATSLAVAGPLRCQVLNRQHEMNLADYSLIRN